MASERANWLKAYTRKPANKGKNWKSPGVEQAYQAWQSARSGASATEPSTPPDLPSGWGTDRTGIAGSWKDKPNLNADEWEFGQNDDKLWFARRINELTGLDPWMKQSVAKWDRDAAARAALTKAAGDQATSATTAIAQANAASQADLAKLIQTKMQGNPEASAGSGAAAAAQQLAAAQAAASAATSAQAQPGIAQYAMQSLANRQASDDSAKRVALLDAYRKLKTAEKTATSEAIAQQYANQARIIAAAIQSGANITREQISQLGQNFRNTQDNETSITTAGISATGRGSGTAANARAKTVDSFVAGIAGMIDGEESTSTNDASGATTVNIKGGDKSWKQVVNSALSQKIPMGAVLAAIANTRRGAGLKRNKVGAVWIAQRMKASGIPDSTIRTTILKNLGIDVGPRAGVAGPVRP